MNLMGYDIGVSASIRLPTLGLELPRATYVGPAMDDNSLAEAIPQEISAVLTDVNGFIAFDGALHVRGISAEPTWHSLGSAWKGERALHVLFPAILPADIPLAEDALGNQFVLRNKRVWFLESETGELHPLDLAIHDWFTSLITLPDSLLPINVVEQFRSEGEELLPGYLLSVYPPFCAQESAAGVSLRAIPAHERIEFLAEFAAQIAGHVNGSRIRTVIDRSGAA
ncbi:MAG TPA: hypothetical protein VF787_13405 [Thermoanaerobaculia bacterium]